MKTLSKIMPWVLLGATFFAFPGFVWAADPISLEPGEPFKALTSITIPALISTGIRIILVIAALIFFIMLLIGGIQWMISGGDKAATEAARSKITAAVIGLVIVFAGWAVIALIKTIWGVDLLQLKIPAIGETPGG